MTMSPRPSFSKVHVTVSPGSRSMNALAPEVVVPPSGSTQGRPVNVHPAGRLPRISETVVGRAGAGRGEGARPPTAGSRSMNALAPEVVVPPSGSTQVRPVNVHPAGRFPRISETVEAPPRTFRRGVGAGAAAPGG